MPVRKKPSASRRHHDHDEHFQRKVLNGLREIAFVMDDVHARLGRLERLSVGIRRDIEEEGEQNMLNVERLVQEVEEQSTVIDSVNALVKGLRDEIVAAAGDQAKLDAIVAKLDANTNRLSAAVTQSDDVEDPTPVDPAPTEDTGGDAGGDTPVNPDDTADNAMGDETSGDAGGDAAAAAARRRK